jgi:predicted dehydrogenase
MSNPAESKMAPVRWGVMGAATIALEVVIPELLRSQACQLVAIASRDADKAAAAAARHGIPKSYGAYDDLLADAEVEAVYIPLPNHLHVPWSAKAAAAGKHVLCEKPLALTAAEAETLIAVREATGVLIQEAFVVRTHPQWLRARELIRGGRIGTLRALNCVFSEINDDPANIVNNPDFGGGGLYDLGCYPVTLARFLFEAEPTRAIALTDLDPSFRVDRLAACILEFESGLANFVCSPQLVLQHEFQIYGTAGRIEMVSPFNPAPAEPARIRVDDGSKLAGASAVTETVPAVEQYGLEFATFSGAIRAGGGQAISLEDSVLNMRAIDALFRSVESGRWEEV